MFHDAVLQEDSGRDSTLCIGDELWSHPVAGGGWEGLKPKPCVVVHAGNESFPLAASVEALKLKDLLCQIEK